MLKKVISIQGHSGNCYGYALYHYLRTCFPENALVKSWIKQEEICVIQNLQQSYLTRFDKWSEASSIISLPEIREIAYELKSFKKSEITDPLGYSAIILEQFPPCFIFYFANEKNEGHAIFVAIKASQNLVLIYDTWESPSPISISLHGIGPLLVKKMIDLSDFQNKGIEKDPTFTYELITYE